MSKNKQDHPFLEKVNSIFPVLFPISIFLSGLGFISLTRFLAVEQKIKTLLQYRSQLPDGYEVGVTEHGVFYHWFTIKEQPILFGLSIIILIVPFLLLFLWGWGWVFWGLRIRDVPFPDLKKR